MSTPNLIGGVCQHLRESTPAMSAITKKFRVYLAPQNVFKVSYLLTSVLPND
jgi:hypothetical protein